MTTRLANVDLRRDEYLVCTYSKTQPGFWISVGPPIRLPATASAGELGQAVRDALNESREGIDDPGIDADPARPLLDAVGVATYTGYMKGTRQVEVFTEDETVDTESVEVIPKRNGGGRSGFTPMTDRMATFVYDSPSQIGAAVIAAFDTATA